MAKHRWVGTPQSNDSHTCLDCGCFDCVGAEVDSECPGRSPDLRADEHGRLLHVCEKCGQEAAGFTTDDAGHLLLLNGLMVRLEQSKDAAAESLRWLLARARELDTLRLIMGDWEADDPERRSKAVQAAIEHGKRIGSQEGWQATLYEATQEELLRELYRRTSVAAGQAPGERPPMTAMTSPAEQRIDELERALAAARAREMPRGMVIRPNG